MDTLALIRLVSVSFLFGLGLLAVFKIPFGFLWKPAVAATEYGHLLAVFAILLALPGWSSASGGAATVLAVASSILLLSPLVRALPVARELPERVALAFGDARGRALPGSPARRSPLVAGDLLRVASSPHVRVEKHVYREHEGASLALNLYSHDDAPRPMPVVVQVHGGSWTRGDMSELPAINHYLAARGYAVAAIDYRLAPEHVFPAASDDVLAAVAFLRANAESLGLDPERVVVMGRSAGAQLALVAAYSNVAPAVRGVVAYYPPVDLVWSHENPANPLVYDSQFALETFLGGPPKDVGSAYVEASPLRQVGPTTPPTLLLHGRRDELVLAAQTRRLERQLAEAGVRHLYVEMPWATHGLDASLAGPGGQLSLFAIERFLHNVTA